MKNLKFTEDQITRNWFKNVRMMEKKFYNKINEDVVDQDIQNQEDQLRQQLEQNNGSTNLRITSFVKNENYTQLMGSISNIEGQLGIEFEFRTDNNTPSVKILNGDNFVDLTDIFVKSLNTLLIYFQNGWKETIQ